MDSVYFTRTPDAIPPMLPRLTFRQKEIRNFLRDYQARNQRPPTVREIAERFGIKSTNGVVCHLKALVRHGVIELDRRTSRGIRLLEKPDGLVCEALP